MTCNWKGGITAQFPKSPGPQNLIYIHMSKHGSSGADIGGSHLTAAPGT